MDASNAFVAVVAPHVQNGQESVRIWWWLCDRCQPPVSPAYKFLVRASWPRFGIWDVPNHVLNATGSHPIVTQKALLV